MTADVLLLLPMQWSSQRISEIAASWGIQPNPWEVNVNGDLQCLVTPFPHSPSAMQFLKFRRRRSELAKLLRAIYDRRISTQIPPLQLEKDEIHKSKSKTLRIYSEIFAKLSNIDYTFHEQVSLADDVFQIAQTAP